MRLSTLIISLALLPSVLPKMTPSVLSASQSEAAKPAQHPQQNPTQNPAQKEDQPVRLTSRLVLVPVSASDASGKPVKDLTAEDFVIEEEGRRQNIASLGEPGKVPVEIALLFDVSGSIRGQFEFE